MLGKREVVGLVKFRNRVNIQLKKQEEKAQPEEAEEEEEDEDSEEQLN